MIGGIAGKKAGSAFILNNIACKATVETIPAKNLVVPSASATMFDLLAGDGQALKRAKRRLIQIDLGTDVVASLNQLAAGLSSGN